MPEQRVRQNDAQPALPVLPETKSGRILSPIIKRTDDDQIEEIVSRLGRRYPRDQISIAELNSRVRGFYSGFAAARIRSFVGIFVERLVRRSIETPTPTA